MTNATRNEIKELVTSTIKKETNNEIIAINIITEKKIEVTCKNKFSKSHIIDVLISNKSIHLIYDSCLFLTKIL